MNNDQLPNDLLIIDVGEAHIDWTRYNLLDRKDSDNINICHPSPYGHTKIALTINRALQREH